MSQLEQRLSPREREIMRLRARGGTRKEIANLIGISPHTVRSHLERVFLKTGARSSLEAVHRLAA